MGEVTVMLLEGNPLRELEVGEFGADDGVEHGGDGYTGEHPESSRQ